MTKQGELKKRVQEQLDAIRSQGLYGHDDEVSGTSVLEWVDEAKKDIYEAIGDFEYKEPYDYKLPILRLKYEEASRKLLLTISKLLKWLGDLDG